MSMYSRLAASAGRAVRAALVLEAAAATFSLPSPAALTARTRGDDAVTAARRLVAYILVAEYGQPISAAARAMKRDRATVTYNVAMATRDLRRDPEARLALDEMQRRIEAARARGALTPPAVAAIVELQTAALARGGKPRACA